LPNLHLRRAINDTRLHGIDGEIIVGSPTAKNVYNVTSSWVRTIHAPGEFAYYVFDYWDSWNPYSARFAELTDLYFEIKEEFPFIKILPYEVLNDEEAVLDYEQRQLDLGYEGIILRNPDGVYKFNRTTLKENNAFKLKRFVDGECEITDMLEEMHNANELEEDERGYAKRSTHQENMVGKGTMGALVVRDLITGVIFNIGTGFTAEQRLDFWVNKLNYIGKIGKYKHFLIGQKVKPRHPVWCGFRDLFDIGTD
jgi:DNA ligase-1